MARFLGMTRSAVSRSVADEVGEAWDGQDRLISEPPSSIIGVSTSVIAKAVARAETKQVHSVNDVPHYNSLRSHPAYPTRATGARRGNRQPSQQGLSQQSQEFPLTPKKRPAPVRPPRKIHAECGPTKWLVTGTPGAKPGFR